MSGPPKPTPPSLPDPHPPDSGPTVLSYGNQWFRSACRGTLFGAVASTVIGAVIWGIHWLTLGPWDAPHRQSQLFYNMMFVGAGILFFTALGAFIALSGKLGRDWRQSINAQWEEQKKIRR